MMILAYLRTKLCSSKMNRERSFIPSRRSRRTSRLHRLSLGSAVAVARTRAVAVWSLPVRVDRCRVAGSVAAAPWHTPAVVNVDDLTTTSMTARSYTTVRCNANSAAARHGFTSQRASDATALHTVALWRLKDTLRAHRTPLLAANYTNNDRTTLSTVNTQQMTEGSSDQTAEYCDRQCKQVELQRLSAH